MGFPTKLLYFYQELRHLLKKNDLSLNRDIHYVTQTELT